MAHDVIDVLIEDHNKLISVMNSLEKEIDKNNGNYDSQFQEFKRLFNMHDFAEDKIVYPAFQKCTDINKLLLKGFQAHHMAEMGVLELRATPYSSESWGPKFLVVKDNILSHMKEEQEKIFPVARNEVDEAILKRLGDEVRESRL